jgi:hypothetical protein
MKSEGLCMCGHSYAVHYGFRFNDSCHTCAPGVCKQYEEAKHGK